jgi:hypothetical protein
MHSQRVAGGNVDSLRATDIWRQQQLVPYSSSEPQRNLDARRLEFIRILSRAALRYLITASDTTLYQLPHLH